MEKQFIPYDLALELKELGFDEPCFGYYTVDEVLNGFIYIHIIIIDKNMKNLYLLPTDKPSILGRFIDTNNLFLRVSNDIPRGENVNIYITSDEEIKDGDWYLDSLVHPLLINTPLKHSGIEHTYEDGNIIIQSVTGTTSPIVTSSKIILTTDQDLINDGIQAIDDEFLEWFVKNPSCEEVVVEKKMLCDYCGEENCDNLRCRGYIDSVWYEIIIPKKIIQIYKINDLKEAFLKGYVAKNNKEDYPFAVQKFLNSKLNENKK